MPKPVKKATKRAKTLNDATLPAPVRQAVKKDTNRPSSDPVTRAKQMMDEHMAKVESANPPWQTEAAVPPVVTFAEQLSAHMKALGAKGGKVGGKRRMETMTQKDRKVLAMKGAAARWAKAKAGKN